MFYSETFGGKSDGITKGHEAKWTEVNESKRVANSVIMWLH